MKEGKGRKLLSKNKMKNPTINQGIVNRFVFFFKSADVESTADLENSGSSSLVFSLLKDKATPMIRSTLISLNTIDRLVTSILTNLAEATTCPMDWIVPPIKADV